MKDACELQIQELTPGLMVAVVNKAKWYRAEVLLVSDFDVLVSLIDFGCKKLVKVHNLRRLDKQFFMTSRKSCKGSLFGVIPANADKQWKPEVINAFKVITEKFNFWGTVKGKKNDIYQLSLFDNPCKRNDMCKFLIDNGFAIAHDAKPTLNAVLVSGLFKPSGINTIYDYDFTGLNILIADSSAENVLNKFSNILMC